MSHTVLPGRGPAILLFFLAAIPASAGEPKLAPDWFAKHAAERASQGTLSGPVKEVWRYPGDCLCVAEGKAFVYSKSGILCKEVATGKDLWEFAFSAIRNECGHVVDVGGGIAFVRASSGLNPIVRVGNGRPIPMMLPFLKGNRASMILLDTGTGALLKRCSYREDKEEMARELERMRAYADASSPIAADAMDKKDRIFATYYAPGGPASPVLPDMAKWTFQDAASWSELFTCEYVPTNGAGEYFLFTGRDDSVQLDLMGNTLSRVDPSAGKVRWETTVSTGGGHAILWHPPLVVLFSARNAVTAYDTETGKPLWRYDWPGEGETYSRCMRALKDGTLLVTDPLINRAPTMARNPITGVTYVAQSNAHLWLTKLDMKGRKVFEQELDFDAAYCKVYLASDRIVITKESLTLCYGPGGKIEGPGRPPRPQEDSEKIKDLHARYEHGTTGTRISICAELGKAGDRTILKQVLSDMQTASSIERQDYPRMLGALHDVRAVPVLVGLLDNPEWSVKHQARESLGWLLPGVVFSDEQWRKWWQVHKHLYEEQQPAATNPASPATPSTRPQ